MSLRRDAEKCKSRRIRRAGAAPAAVSLDAVRATIRLLMTMGDLERVCEDLDGRGCRSDWPAWVDVASYLPVAGGVA